MAKFVRASHLIRAFKQSATPTVLQGLTVCDTWVDTDDNTLYVCTSVSPVTFAAVGGSASAGGSDTQVQFNDGGSFGGDAGMTYNKTTNTLTVDTVVANLTGNVTGNASTVTTNANLTGDVTSVGNATTLGTVPPSKGGTGLTTLTANNVILGNGTSNVQFVAPSTSGNVLTSNGTTWTSAAPSGGGLTQPQVMAIQSLGL